MMIFSRGNAFEHVVCKMLAIFCQLQCIKWLHPCFQQPSSFSCVMSCPFPLLLDLILKLWKTCFKHFILTGMYHFLFNLERWPVYNVGGFLNFDNDSSAVGADGLVSFTLSEIILCMGSANERWCYIVMSTLIGGAHTQHGPWLQWH